MQTIVAEGFRLSPQQKRLWSQIDGTESVAYRVQCAVLIEGRLESAVLKSAIEDVVARHEILRTTFQYRAGIKLPLQVIADGRLEWKSIDLSGVAEGDQQRSLNELFAVLKDAPFILESGPVVRGTLLNFGSQRNILLLSVSALCADGPSIRIILDEIARAYTARLRGESLDDQPLQYADISEYFAQLLEETPERVEYWGRYNDASLYEHALYFQRPRHSSLLFNPQTVSIDLHADVADRFNRAAGSDVTLDSFLLSAWQATLGRMTDWAYRALGVGFAGRRLEGLETVPGAFIRYLPFEAKPDRHTTFVELVKEVSETSATHAEWQNVFDWDELSPSYLPVCFDFQDLSARHQAGEVIMSVLVHYACTERFDLKLSCILTGTKLLAQFHYDPVSFERRDIQCLAEQFQALTESAASSPGNAVGELNMLTDSTRHRLLYEFNETEQDYSDASFVHLKMEEHARANPDAVAAVSDEASLSFRELNEKANQLAHYLIAQGVGPDVLVGICLERSLSMLVGIVAVLKAGGAYLPLDPAYPGERLRFMIDNAQLSAVITERRLVDRLSTDGTKPVLVDEEAPTIGRQNDQNPKRPVNEHNLAYVIYTSGSTGQPKGVMLTHGGLRNYLTWCTANYETAKGQGAPVHSSLSFDLTVTSLFSPLMAGRKVVLIKEDEADAGELLSSALLRRPDFSLIKITPAHLEVLALLLHPHQLRGITRTLVIGGEALYASHFNFWRAHALETRIINEYGPTEAVVGCCVHEVKPEVRIDGPIPIGRPIANTGMYVLDERMNPAPFMVTGEIYIGGAGLARGYLNRPDLTAEKFVPNPFSRQPGERLYRTGDIGRYGADGTLEFLGRVDDQVKIKGYRIELGEIEITLLGLSEVRQAVVVVREETGDKRLIGYVALHPGMMASGAELQARLRAKLPEYMVPIIVVLNSLPLTRNGKVDRDALPAPDRASVDPEQGYVAPKTPEEQQLAELWSKALRVSRIGVHDNFFEFGGDSILSIQIANRASAAGLRITPRQIFQNRTIAELAQVVERIQPARTVDESSSGPVPLTPIQHWFFEHQLPEPHHWNQAAMLEVRWPIEPAVLEKAWQHVVKRHDALRLRFSHENRTWRQLCAPPDEAHALKLKSLSGVREDEQETALATFAADFQKSLDLSAGPIAGAALIDFDPGKLPRLLLAIHHLAVDVVSWGVMMEELQLACEQISRDEPVSLPAKTTSFVTWARRLEEHAQSEELRQELPYWTTALDRWACKVPVDQPQGINSQESARIVWVSLDEERTRTLLQEVPKVYHTMINDVLLTAMVQAFCDWTQSRSLLIDLENHGREDIFDDVDLSRTVGWFTCIFPLLLEAGDASRPEVLLKSVKEQIRNVPSGGIGYGLLRYMSVDAATRDALRRLPQAEICFNYLGRAGQLADDNGPFAPKGSTGPARSGAGRRRYLIEFDASITGNKLRAAWTYSENVHSRKSVEGFANGFITALEAIIDHCSSPGAGGFTPSDFSIPNLSQRELDRLIAELAGSEVKR
jgi:amino acid adenylation domain-containing protein/non-ribosomal peptide synthase protein (TIGR01720 family)